MSNINIKYFKSANNRKIYRLSNINFKDIYLKLENVHLPFNCQKYNNNYYINVEILENDDKYIQNISLINNFEDHILKTCNSHNNDSNLNIDSKKFVSNIKDRLSNKHIKLMLKKTFISNFIINEIFNYIEGFLMLTFFFTLQKKIPFFKTGFRF